MDTMFQDLKFVFRSLARRPGFTSAVLLTLGLGIGANTAIFSVVNSVLLNPLPFEAADRLVTPNVMSTQGFYISTSIPNYYDWKDQPRSFESFGAYRGNSAVLTGFDRPEVIRTREVLGDFYEVLRVDAAIGRTITAAESEPGARAIATVSHTFWENRLEGDPDVLGRTLISSDQPFEIVGVMPKGLAFPRPRMTSIYPWDTSPRGSRGTTEEAPPEREPSAAYFRASALSGRKSIFHGSLRPSGKARMTGQRRPSWCPSPTSTSATCAPRSGS